MARSRLKAKSELIPSYVAERQTRRFGRQRDAGALIIYNVTRLYLMAAEMAGGMRTDMRRLVGAADCREAPDRDA